MTKSEDVYAVNRIKCLICGKLFLHLGSHIYHKHKILAREYKEKFSLPYKMGLVSEQVRDKQSKACIRHKAWKNFVETGKKYQFKKGRTGQRRISALERLRIAEQLAGIQNRYKKLQKCPICRMKFHHVESHLYQKHSMLMINKQYAYDK